MLSISSFLSSVSQSCPTLCNPMNRSTPVLPVYYQLPESTQIHVTILSSIIPFSSCPQSFPALESFQMSQLFTSSGQSIGVSASTSVFQDGLAESPCSPQDSQESSPTPQFKTINSSALSFLYSPTNTFIHEYGKNHSLDQMDLCWHSNVVAF